MIEPLLSTTAKRCLGWVCLILTIYNRPRCSKTGSFDVVVVSNCQLSCVASMERHHHHHHHHHLYHCCHRCDSGHSSIRRLLIRPLWSIITDRPCDRMPRTAGQCAEALRLIIRAGRRRREIRHGRRRCSRRHARCSRSLPAGCALYMDPRRRNGTQRNAPPPAETNLR